MLDAHLIREQSEKIKEGISRKGKDPVVIDAFLAVDEEWRQLVAQVDDARSRQNELTEQIKDDPEKRDALIKQSKEIKAHIQELEPQLKSAEERRREAIMRIPNIPFDDVPVGKSEDENRVLREEGKKPDFDFDIRDYIDIGSSIDAVDTDRAAKVSGSRFGYLKNDAALLELALVHFAFDELVKEGFTPVIPPVMIKEEPYEGMGRLTPDDKDERYYLQQDDLYLVGSAEHTIGPMHMNETFDEEELPKRYVGFSSCFRREAGSYGKDTRGILRVHQFDKVEMFSFTTPDKSEEEHRFLLSMQERLMKKLELPYRVVEICTGDMGWTDARQFDIETWLPGQGQYRETHSCSNTTDFQARGVNVRYRQKQGNGRNYVHMLNATALAIQRMVIAIMENYQTEDGFAWPSILRRPGA